MFERNLISVVRIIKEVALCERKQPWQECLDFRTDSNVQNIKLISAFPKCHYQSSLFGKFLLYIFTSSGLFLQQQKEDDLRFSLWHRCLCRCYTGVRKSSSSSPVRPTCVCRSWKLSKASVRRVASTHMSFSWRSVTLHPPSVKRCWRTRVSRSCHSNRSDTKTLKSRSKYTCYLKLC